MATRIPVEAIIGLDEHVKALMMDYFIREVAPVLEDKTTRRIAREEIASLCGLVLRRLQDLPFDVGVTPGEFASIFGEALRDFLSDTGEPGK